MHVIKLPKKSVMLEIGEFIFAMAYLALLVTLIASPFVAAFFAVRFVVSMF